MIKFLHDFFASYRGSFVTVKKIFETKNVQKDVLRRYASVCDVSVYVYFWYLGNKLTDFRRKNSAHWPI